MKLAERGWLGTATKEPRKLENEVRPADKIWKFDTLISDQAKKNMSKFVVKTLDKRVNGRINVINIVQFYLFLTLNKSIVLLS